MINSELEPYIQRQTCAHELAPARPHKGWGYYPMMESTLFAPGCFKREANECTAKTREFRGFQLIPDLIGGGDP